MQNRGGTDEMPKGNFAARAGYWSAHNRKKAIWGWISFVLIATVVGGGVGINKIATEDLGNGESRTADRAIADAGFPDDADEQVLVQTRTDAVDAQDPAFKAAVADVVSRLQAT